MKTGQILCETWLLPQTNCFLVCGRNCTGGAMLQCCVAWLPSFKGTATTQGTFSNALCGASKHVLFCFLSKIEHLKTSALSGKYETIIQTECSSLLKAEMGANFTKKNKGAGLIDNRLLTSSAILSKNKTKKTPTFFCVLVKFALFQALICSSFVFDLLSLISTKS